MSDRQRPLMALGRNVSLGNSRNMCPEAAVCTSDWQYSQTQRGSWLWSEATEHRWALECGY